MAEHGVVERHEDRLRDRIEAGSPRCPGSSASPGQPRTPTMLLRSRTRPADAYRFLAERGRERPRRDLLRARGLAAARVRRPGGLRVGLAPYTDDGEVDRLLAALAEFVAPAG